MSQASKAKLGWRQGWCVSPVSVMVGVLHMLSNCRRHRITWGLLWSLRWRSKVQPVWPMYIFLWVWCLLYNIRTLRWGDGIFKVTNNCLGIWRGLKHVRTSFKWSQASLYRLQYMPYVWENYSDLRSVYCVRCVGSLSDSSANTAYIYWGSLWGQTCCSMVDGKLQLKHAPAAKKGHKQDLKTLKM